MYVTHICIDLFVLDGHLMGLEDFLKRKMVIPPGFFFFFLFLCRIKHIIDKDMKFPNLIDLFQLLRFLLPAEHHAALP